MKHGFAAVLPLTMLSAMACPALGQVDVPASAEPGRSDQPILNEPFLPRAGETVGVANPQPTIETVETGVTFVLNGITVQGSSVISQTEFEALYSGYIGEEIEVGLVFEIAAKATALYRSKGYILSQVIVPPQEIDGGRVTLRAVEGFVDSVEIQGDVGSSRDLVARMGDMIKQSRPLNADVLERYLLLAGDLAGLTVEGVLSPSQTTPGAATLTIVSSHDWFEGSFAVLTHGSEAVGPVLTEAQATFNSALGLHERIIVKGGLAGQPNELQTGEVQVSVPVSVEGTNVFGRIAWSNSYPGDGLDVFGVNTTGMRYSLGVKHPFIRSRLQNLFAGLRFDWNDLSSDSTAFGPLSEDHLRVVRLSAEYDFVDTILGADKPAVTALTATLSQGLDIFGATASTDPYPSRTNADGSFTSLQAEIQRQQSLGNDFGMLFAATGQYAGTPLLASEEFGLGGLDYLRGYDPSAVTGDRGIAAKLELQYNGDPGNLADTLNGYQLYGFFDVGAVENINFDGLGNSQSQSLWSAGAGVRLDFINDVTADFTVAYRGTDDASVSTFDIDRFRALVKIEGHF